MQRLRVVLTLLTVILALLISTPVMAEPRPDDDQPAGVPAPGSQDELEQAVLLAVDAHRDGVLAFTLFDILIDHIEYSPDGQQALVWLAFVDPATGTTLATEPGMAIGTLVPDIESGVEHWQVTLQADMAWDTALEALPDEVMPAADRSLYRTPDEVRALATKTYTGYYLPWQKGLTKGLSGSIGHVFTYKSCPEDCMYAFDFADGTMFPLAAAKGGVVKYAKWTCANGDEDCSNYLVLQDYTTSPVTYQLYLHLAYNSIPSALRTSGAVVRQGDFIGNVDDTGYSTGHHLHFHVHTNPYSYWGSSVDITFADVSVNGGRPRTCAEAAAYPQYGDECMPGNLYTSGNVGDDVPPSGYLDFPLAKTTFNSGSLAVNGTMKDNLALGYGRLMVRTESQPTWTAMGPTLTGSTFDTTLNLCSNGIPNGPFQLGLQVWDAVGNTSGVIGARTLVNDSNCTVGLACRPASDQIALYNDPDFGGACILYGMGSYSSIDTPLGPNNAESVLVGSTVRAMLYDLGGNQGRRDVFRTKQASFDNVLLASAGVDSLRVEELNKIPYAVNLSIPTNRLGENPTSADSLMLYLGGGQGATEYWMDVASSAGTHLTLDWQPNKDWSVGNLPAGTYTWTAKARNTGGTQTAQKTFTVTDAGLSVPEVVGLPYLEEFETEPVGWRADGLWRWAYITRSAHNNNAYVMNISDTTQHYNDAVIRGSSLTSPAIFVDSAGYFLRYQQYTLTENANRYWDQRWLQVSVDGAPFVNVMQLTGERRGVWLESAPLDLTPYTGHTIQLRWYFNTVDGYYNENYGWVIDNVRITSEAPAACTEAVMNDAPATAQSIAIDTTVSGVICPGDTDWYAVSLGAGQRIYADTEAAVHGSSLNTYLRLVDGDGVSVLKENDNDGTTTDSWIEYAIKRTGTYYFKVSSANYPGEGGSDAAYDLRVRYDRPPTVRWLAPVSETVPGVQPFTAGVLAQDDREVDKVEFFYHSADWNALGWTALGSDTDGSNGWNVTIDPVALGLQDGAGLMARTTDSAGNQRITVYWNLKLDIVPPQTYLEPLPAVSPTTYIWLAWRVLSGVGDLDHFELLKRENGGGWVTISSDLDANLREYAVWGTAGIAYDFCLRGVDVAGNREACPEPPLASTQIAATCDVDTYEADDSFASSSSLTMGVAQNHNLCLNDVDWVKMELTAGQPVFIHASPMNEQTTVYVEVFGPGSPGELIASQSSPDWGNGVGWYYTPAVSGTYSVRITAADNRLWGSGAQYLLRVSEPVQYFLPIIQ
jgi:murein DD-endopeptidase MepM/ murein hydrolase activator NlpD